MRANARRPAIEVYFSIWRGPSFHEWMFCFDPDERVIVGDVRELVQSPRSEACNAVRVRLFDAHI